ncbi:MAG TPA: DsbA family oxidoreductase [Acidimicrobiales bacterium]|nr:DsbA family oxidoreductase [Acidimicrobiales bacterium]
MQVEIWSDVVCPWCYIGKRRFEKALAAFEHADQVEVVWKAFELDPNAPFARSRSMAEQLAAKYRRSVPQAEAMLASMDRAFAGEGLDVHLADTTGGNTFDAHRVLHLALEVGGPQLQGQVKEALLQAYFVEHRHVADPDVLREVAVAAGLPEAEVDATLADRDRYAEAVRAEEREAHELGSTGVPFFVIDRTFAVPGAQDVDTFLTVLRRSWERSHPQLVTVDPAAGACDGDSCAVPTA